MISDRTYAWDDEARVIVSPMEPSIPRFHADLAACVRRAIEVADDKAAATTVSIEHASGFIEMDEIRKMAADPSLPTETLGNRVGTTSQKP